MKLTPAEKRALSKAERVRPLTDFSGLARRIAEVRLQSRPIYFAIVDGTRTAITRDGSVPQ